MEPATCFRNTLNEYNQEAEKIQKVAVNMLERHFIRQYHEDTKGGHG